MEKRKTRIILPEEFIKDIVIAAAAQYPNETRGALDGARKTLIKSPGDYYFDIALKKIIPYEDSKRKKTSVDASWIELILKNLNLYRDGRFIGTYHSHTYPGERRLPSNPELSISPEDSEINDGESSDLDAILEVWKALEKASGKRLEEYIEALVSIRQIKHTGTVQREKRWNFDDFPVVKYYGGVRRSFEARVDCFYINREERSVRKAGKANTFVLIN